MEEFSIDINNEDMQMVPVELKGKKKKKESASSIDKPVQINPLRNERIIVRHIPKQSGMWGNNPKHVFAGGMAENAIKTYVVPKLNSGLYVNVLTDNEKSFLEEVMGLEPNALSIYKKENNFWSDANDEGISYVKLTKADTYLDLSNPEDYIRYKILLANKNYIASSLQELQDRPKATYQYVIISQGAEDKLGKTKMTYTMECYKEYGKIEDDWDKLKLIIETVDGRPIAATSKLEFLQNKCNEAIQKDAKLFLKVIKDPYLDTKVLIKKSVALGNIVTRNNLYYLRSANETIPLCEVNEESTFSVAARYLNDPKHQEVLLSLQAKLN